MRFNNRSADQIRQIKITRNYTIHAEGSVLVEYGNTKVICNATVDKGVPRFQKGTGKGWLTAEYGMLPRATNERMIREAARKQSGRTLEIQRLIGRSLRSCVNLKLLGEYTITIDCDVIQADGGTRTAAITGSCIALKDAISYMLEKKIIKEDPLLFLIASVSVGIYKNQPVLDLDYKEDSNAETDMNIVMNEQGNFIEIQGTAEGKPFSNNEMNAMLALAKAGIKELFDIQKQAL